MSLALKILRLKENAIPITDFVVVNDGNGEVLSYWNQDKLGPRPSETELSSVDLSKPSSNESTLLNAVQILKDDVPSAWRTSANAQQRITWALKRLFVEVRNELKA